MDRGQLVAGAQVVARTVQLLKLVSKRGGGRLIADLVTSSGLTRPTVYRLLSALKATGLIEQDAETKRWYLGPESYVLGMLAATRFNIERIAHQFVLRIADRTAESAFLSIRRGTECVCLLREEGTYPIRTHVLQAGDRLPLGVGSAGLAILAALDDEEVDEAIDANRDQFPRRFSNYTPKLIKQLVTATRETGYAVNQGLLLAGSWGVAAAVRDCSRKPLAALSITAVEARVQGKRVVELGRLLLEEADQLAVQLRSSPTMLDARKKTA
jgi:DNA-binding IclR family transcriptional regulator